ESQCMTEWFSEAVAQEGESVFNRGVASSMKVGIDFEKAGNVCKLHLLLRSRSGTALTQPDPSGCIRRTSQTGEVCDEGSRYNRTAKSAESEKDAHHGETFRSGWHCCAQGK